MEKRYKHRDGHWVFADTSATLLRHVPGTPRCLLASIVDISERKLAEAALHASKERYEQLVNNTDTGLVVVDDRGVVLSANEPYVRLSGARRREDIVGLPVTEWTSPEEKLNSIRAVALCAKQGFIQNFETVYLHGDGTRLHIVLDASVERTTEGSIRIAALCRNITDRKLAEAERQRLEEQLRAAQKMEAIGASRWWRRSRLQQPTFRDPGLHRVRHGSASRGRPVQGRSAGSQEGRRSRSELTRQLLAFGRRQLLQPTVLSLNQVAGGVEKMLRRILGEDIDYVQVLAPRPRSGPGRSGAD